MAVADRIHSRAKTSPRLVTTVLSLIGDAVVVGTFEGFIPLFPDLSRETVVFLGDAIAVINATALVAILVGVRFIRRGQVRKHRAAMLAAFALILLFLATYLLKVGGGFEKAILADGWVWWAYVVMLGVHVVLSNSDTDWVRDRYADFDVHGVTARRNVTSKAGRRGRLVGGQRQAAPVGEDLDREGAHQASSSPPAR